MGPPDRCRGGYGLPGARPQNVATGPEGDRAATGKGDVEGDDARVGPATMSPALAVAVVALRPRRGRRDRAAPLRG